jgi:uncharacterized protein YjbI with pentapeptide repeats
MANRFTYIFALLICTALLGSVAQASIRACVEKELRSKPSDKEFHRILNNHTQWLEEHKLFNSDSWSNRSANQLRAILTDPKRADLSNMDLSGAHIDDVSLRGAKLDWANIDNGIIRNSDFSKASMKCATLNGAQIENSSFDDATLEKSSFNNTSIKGTDFSNANLVRASFKESKIFNTVFINSTLSYANLTNASIVHSRLVNSKLKNAKVDFARFDDSIWELDSGELPPSYSSARIVSISKLKYQNSPSSLIELRESFKKAGLRKPERDVTYAIRKTENEKRMESGFMGRIEASFNFILFDLTSRYGKTPSQPLIILAILVFMFSIPYTFAIYRNDNRDGIWRVWNKERIRKDLGGEPERIHEQTYKAFMIAIQFSIVSAFRMGWKDLNVGTWISNIQKREYSLHGSGWIRSLSGLQSIISVYLLAIWALTYFGRPFG